MLKTFSIIVLFISLVNASLIKGKITTKDGKALGNANIVSLPSGKGAQSDDSGGLAKYYNESIGSKWHNDNYEFIVDVPSRCTGELEAS